jgi:hypothetical protein
VEVEYDCMTSYDIRFGYKLQDRLRQAFGDSAQTEITLNSDQITLPSEVFNSWDRFVVWITNNWFYKYITAQPAESLYLAGTKDVWPRVGFIQNQYDLSANACGFTCPPPGSFVPGVAGTGAVLLKDFIDYSFVKDDVQEACLITGIHELGHARSNLLDADLYPSVHVPGCDCVMEWLHLDSRGRLVSGHQWFCGQCKSTLANTMW